MRNRKRLSQIYARFNDKSVGNPNDAYNVDHATWLRNTSRPKSIRDDRDLELVSKLSRGDEDAGEQMLHALPTW